MSGSINTTRVLDRRDAMMDVFCGIDWAENHHGIAIVDAEGEVRASCRITDDAHGFQQLLELLASHGDGDKARTPVAIETTRGLLVASLRATGREVYAINPMAAARYRDRHAVSRKKSDAQDALVLANILRTDRWQPATKVRGRRVPDVVCKCSDGARLHFVAAPDGEDKSVPSRSQIRAVPNQTG
ncbi:hypothetical protein E5206_14175 [Arthrobacter sp. PAMC25564]|nr:hypothetical protein E5206_14175 [Arthrobacter sp. PAMC25564]